MGVVAAAFARILIAMPKILSGNFWASIAVMKDTDATSVSIVCRLSVFDIRCDDDRMNGFGSCINCGDSARRSSCDGHNAERGGPCSGMDHAACNYDSGEGCHYTEMRVLWNPIDNTEPDCWQPDQSYCYDGTYDMSGRRMSDGDPWTSRIFVCEETPLTHEVLAAMAACEASGRVYIQADQSCVESTALCMASSDSLSIENAIVNRYSINWDANGDGSISDGGGDMYDGGNHISTSLCDNIAPYTDNMDPVNSDCFGAGGHYTMDIGTSM
eukprot:SAG11_NODE_8600_length_997_cov_0.713808_1_plen_270_part_01